SQRFKGKKKWFKIVAPKLFGEREIGESYVFDSSQLIGKIFTYNLMNITRDIKKQKINVKFKVTEVNGGVGKTEVLGFEVMPASIKRMIRRRKGRVDDSFVVLTSDKKKVRIKPLLQTASNTNKAVMSALRKESKKFIVDYASKHDFETLVNDCINFKIQKSIRSHVKNIYPIKACEIRVLKIDERAKNVEKAENLEKKKEVEEQKKAQQAKKEEKTAEKTSEQRSESEKDKVKASEKKEPAKKADKSEQKKEAKKGKTDK
ncbi:hypothetical protein D6745_02520, partial [Candidatus Woesearchaeota archaeon]